jgi:hypothetical protein
MLSFNGIVNIINNLPQELVLLVFNYLNGIDMVNFINNNKEDYIYTLNINKDELNIWNFMKNSKNKLFEWCKILYYADIYNNYYKSKYEETARVYKNVFTLQSNKKKRYSRKLYIGLFMNEGLHLDKAYIYSDLHVDKISMMFNIMIKMPNQFNIEILYDAININKDLNSFEDYVNYAIKIKEIRNLSSQFILSIHLNNVISNFPDKYYQRFISLLSSNVAIRFAYKLSNPSRNFTDELINKFFELKNEFNNSDNFNIMEELLVRYLRNNKAIKIIRQLASKNISYNGIYNILNLDKDFLDFIIKNDYTFDFDGSTWYRAEYIFNNHNIIIQDIFNKFTIKQQNTLRINELRGEDTYELIKNFIKENINKVYMNTNMSINLNPNLITITPLQYFQVYTELTDFQIKIFEGFIKKNLNFEQALNNTYQILEYNPS